MFVCGLSFNRRVIGWRVIVAFYLHFLCGVFLFLLVMQIDKLHANIFQQQMLKNVSAAYVVV